LGGAPKRKRGLWPADPDGLLRLPGKTGVIYRESTTKGWGEKKKKNLRSKSEIQLSVIEPKKTRRRRSQ